MGGLGEGRKFVDIHLFDPIMDVSLQKILFFKYLTTIPSLIKLVVLLVQISSYNTRLNACLLCPCGVDSVCKGTIQR